MVAADGGFMIALPYGSRTNWLRNVLASGSATIVHEGHSYAVERPEIVPMQDVQVHFTASDQRLFRLYATDQVLLFRRVESERAGAWSAEATRDADIEHPAVDSTRSLGAPHVAWLRHRGQDSTRRLTVPGRPATLGRRGGGRPEARSGPVGRVGASVEPCRDR